MIPLLQVNSVQETIAFYTGALGFEVTSTYPKDGEPGWCMLRRDDAYLMFSEHAVHNHDDDHGDGRDHHDDHDNERP